MQARRLLGGAPSGRAGARSPGARVSLLVLVVATALGSAGCGAGSDEPSSGGSSPTTAASTPADPTAGVPVDLHERCLSLLPVEAKPRPVTLAGPGGDMLAAVFEAPDARSAVVLLHQTGRAGLCGWGRYAVHLAERGISAVALDMCGYGGSSCSSDTAPVEQVAAAIDLARTELGARRVVLVGASMGGSSTVMAAAGGARVDGWVDVSGPSAWGNAVLLDLVPDLPDARRVPGLVVQARSDGDGEYALAERLARLSGARFLDGGSGHGYELMTDWRGRLLPPGRAVIDFVEAA